MKIIGWLTVLRDRCWIKCPACGGDGGEMSGYYEPEWTECWACYAAWEEAEDHGVDWSVGRLGPVRWIWAKLGPLWNWRCAIFGLHQVDPTLPQACAVCYEKVDRHNEKAPA